MSSWFYTGGRCKSLGRDVRIRDRNPSPILDHNQLDFTTLSSTPEIKNPLSFILRLAPTKQLSIPLRKLIRIINPAHKPNYLVTLPIVAAPEFFQKLPLSQTSYFPLKHFMTIEVQHMQTKLEKLGYINSEKWATLEKWVTLQERITLGKGGLHQKKIVTLKKMGHTRNSRSHLKNGSHFEKKFTLRKKVTL